MYIYAVINSDCKHDRKIRRYMKRILYILTLCCIVNFAVSCDRDNENNVGIKFSKMSDLNPVFEYMGGTKEYTFTTSHNWSVTAADEWISVTPESGGKYDNNFSISVEANEVGENRESYIIVALTNGNAVKIPITQLMCPRFDTEECEAYAIEAEGGSIDVAISTNQEYTLTIPTGAVSWLSAEVSDTRAMRDESIRFNVAPNVGNDTRIAKVIAADEAGNPLCEFLIVQSTLNTPYNEISYFTDNEERAELGATEEFGARLLYHIHDGRKGRLIFNSSVTRIPANLFAGNTELTHIVLPPLLKDIDVSAFDGCANLASLELPEGVTYVGNRCFAGCSSVTEFSLPSTVYRIGDSIFDGCSGTLEIHCAIHDENVSTTEAEHWLHGSNFNTVTLHNTIGKATFLDYEPLEEVFLGEDVAIINGRAFGNCPNIEAVHVGSITQWCAIHFGDEQANPLSSGTTDLILDEGLVTRLDTPSSVTAVGRFAFANYTKLESIRLNESVTSIGWNSFRGCNVESIYLGPGITTIGTGAFMDCVATTLTVDFNMPSSEGSVTSSKHWLHGITITNLIVGPNVTTIGNFFFSETNTTDTAEYECSLETLTIGDNVTSIGTGAFSGSKALRSVTFGSGLRTIGEHAFFQCYSLTEVTLPEGVETIDDYAFNSCTALRTVNIPATTTYLGKYAFRECDAIEHIYCRGEVPPTMGNDYVFDIELPTYTIHVPATSVDAYRNGDGWRYFSNVVVGDL